MVFTKIAHKYVSKQMGGANNNTGAGMLSLLLVGLFILIINASVVYYSYNLVMPKLLLERFVPITFFDAVLLVMLGHALLG